MEDEEENPHEQIELERRSGSFDTLRQLTRACKMTDS
jgi:hypothetical protein